MPNWRRIKSDILNRFMSDGYDVKVNYYHDDGQYPVFCVRVRDVDANAWDIIEDIEDEYNLGHDDSYTDDDGYRVWELF